MSPRHRLWLPRVWRYALVDVFHNASLRRCEGRKASILKLEFQQNRADRTAIVGFSLLKKQIVHFHYDFLQRQESAFLNGQTKHIALEFV